MKTLTDMGVGILLPLPLLMLGTFFTIYLGGFFLLRPIKLTKLFLAPRKKGEISPLRALSVSLAGTLGVGNITGVAVALLLGGAGSLFWMWVSALFSMVLKYAEVTLAMRYRRFEDGKPLGGPMYYMKNGIGGGLGKTLALLFSAAGVLSSFFVGNIVQSGAAAEAARATFHLPKAVFGIVAAIVTALIIFGGFRGISRVTAVLIPLMSAAYLLLSLYAIFKDHTKLPRVLQAVKEGAFTFSAAGGGILGSLVSGGIRHGIAKGCFSHEAGCGTAPMAHIESDAAVPAMQGCLGIFEVFFDTVVMCTLTGLVILLSGGEEIITENGMLLVIYAYSHYFGKAAAYFITISIALFAFASVLCWAHYGRTCLRYFTPSKRLAALYLIAYSATVAVGAVLPEGVAWGASDIFIALMTAINLPCLFLLRHEVKKETALAGLLPH